MLTYKKTDASGNAVTIAPDGSETIDGQASVQLTVPYQSVQVATNGANWFLLPVLPFAGGVQGPQSSTDNALALWDGTDGAALKDSPWVLDPATGAMTVDGSSPGLASTGGGDIAVTPDGAGRTQVASLTTSGTAKLGGPIEADDYDDVGDVSGTVTVTPASYSRIRLTADTTVTLTPPSAGALSTQILEVVQDGTGGRTPTFTGFGFIGTEPDWPGQAAGAVTLLGWMVTPTAIERIWVIEETV